MPYKKKLFAWTTLGHFYKKFFSRKFKKKIYEYMYRFGTLS